jgi:hypothetical protein
VKYAERVGISRPLPASPAFSPGTGGNQWRHGQATALPQETQPRAATAADIPELVHLRALMLSSLGQDPGSEDPYLAMYRMSSPPK